MPGLTTIVRCFEDACPEDQVEAAEENVHKLLETVTAAVDRGELSADRVPLIFVRVRNLAQFKHFAQGLTKAQVRSLCGVNFPKFNAENGYESVSYTHRFIVTKRENSRRFGCRMISATIYLRNKF